MTEYIDKEALRRFPIRLNHYDKEHGNEHFVLGIESVLEYAESLPAADVAEVRHGKWVPYEQPLGAGYSIPDYKPTHCCSHCKGLGWEFYAICPHCGAKMDGKSDDNDT